MCCSSSWHPCGRIRSRSAKVVVIISLLWMGAGAWIMCRRQGFGRVLVLTILYLGTAGFFILILLTLLSDEPPLVEGLNVESISAAVYLFTSLVLTHSKHVKRLTSRAYE